jgi:sugar/nucleoside kinase (ribokinase family)
MAMKPHYDIIVPGTYFCDVIFTGLPTFPSLGAEIVCQDLNIIPGGTLNHIIALKRLGVNVGWIGALGNDFFSKFVHEMLQTEGIDTSLVTHIDRSLKQVTVSLSFPHERAFITYADPTPDETELLLAGLEQISFRHLHFPSLWVDEAIPPLIHQCHERGIQISMDCQFQEVTLDSPLVCETLSQIDIFMPNASEAQKLTQTENLPDVLNMLAQLVPYVVIKNGGEGALARRNSLDYHEPALQLSAVDTTGAGDVFNGGFLAAHLQGHDTPTCLRWGNFCAGRSTLGPGPASAPTRAQLDEWLAGQTI